MRSNHVKVGIVGLGRWAKVLAQASRHSDRLEITAAYSRTDEKRTTCPRVRNVSGEGFVRHAR